VADVWACTQCRSLNQGKNRCYKCRAPRAIGGVAPTEMSVFGQAPAVKPAGRYRSSAFRAVLVSVSILALAVVGIVATVIAGETYRRFVGPGGTAAAAAAAPTLIELAIARVALVVASLVTFAAWISRVVENIPALTGSFPLATPRSTIVEVLIPFFNFFRIPPILREALRLLDPRGNGDALVAAALLPLFIGLLGDWPGGILMTIVVALLAQNVQQFANVMTAYSAVLAASVAIGSVFLVAVIARVERLSAARARERRQAAAPGAG
jgi:hypothetical protein